MLAAYIGNRRYRPAVLGRTELLGNYCRSVNGLEYAVKQFNPDKRSLRSGIIFSTYSPSRTSAVIDETKRRSNGKNFVESTTT